MSSVDDQPADIDTDLSQGANESRGQGLTGRLDTGLTALTIIFWMTILTYAYTQAIPRAQFGVLFLGGALLIYIIDEIIDSLNIGDNLDVFSLSVIGGLLFVANAYLLLAFDTLYFDRVGYALPWEYVLGVCVIISVAYLTYRSYGLAFLGVLLTGIVYALIGPALPGLLSHTGHSPFRIINILVWDFDGFYGSITRIVAAWVALFLLYAGLLTGYGAFDLILRISFRATEYVKSGVAQSAVTASMLIGSINGAQTANAAMTGSITIPMMKKAGIKDETAAAIEAVASSGGQIMPPIMGASAFLMASFLGISYFEVLVAALIPAFIFFASVAVAVHFASIKQLDDSDRDLTDELDKSKTRNQLVVDGIKFGIPFVLLLFILGVLQWSVTVAALWVCIAMIITGIGVPVIQSIWISGMQENMSLVSNINETFRSELWSTVDGFRTGALILAPIAIIIAAINGIVDLFVTTGVPGAFSLALFDVSGGVLLVALIVSMIACIILGLGMPTVAAYTIVALLIAPGLIDTFFLPDIAVHFFVLYAAIISGLTPPIAISVVITTGIAGSNFWRTCLEALKIAFPLLVLPFVFIYNPEIVTGGITLYTILSSAILLIGALMISFGFNSYTLTLSGRRGIMGKGINSGVRFMYVVLGIVAMAYPNMMVRVGAIIISLLIFVFYVRPTAQSLSTTTAD